MLEALSTLMSRKSRSPRHSDAGAKIEANVAKSFSGTDAKLDQMLEALSTLMLRKSRSPRHSDTGAKIEALSAMVQTLKDDQVGIVSIVLLRMACRALARQHDLVVHTVSST